MLYTKFEGHRPSVFGEDLWRVFTIHGHGSHLGHMTKTVWTNFLPPSHWGSIWNLALTDPAVSEKMFEECGRQTTDRRAHTITEPKGSGELKRGNVSFKKVLSFKKCQSWECMWPEFIFNKVMFCTVLRTKIKGVNWVSGKKVWINLSTKRGEGWKEAFTSFVLCLM